MVGKCGEESPINTKKIAVSDEILGQWQKIADLLAAVLDIPAALIMRLQAEEIAVLVSSQGDGNPYHPGASEKLADSGLYCETVIRTQELLLVPDALADKDWRDNPDVKLNMIAYLGFPLRWPNQDPFGTICVLDRLRNEFSETSVALMERFRELIEHHLEMIYMNRILGDKNERLVDYLAELQTLRGLVAICSHCKSIRDGQGQWHAIEHYLINHPETEFSHGICPQCLAEHY